MRSVDSSRLFAILCILRIGNVLLLVIFSRGTSHDRQTYLSAILKPFHGTRIIFSLLDSPSLTLDSPRIPKNELTGR